MARSAKSADQKADAGAAALVAGGVVLVIVLLLGMSRLLPVAALLLLAGIALRLSAGAKRRRDAASASPISTEGDAEG